MTGRVSHTPLGAGGEFERIRGIWRRLGDRAAAGGEDCAIVTVGGERLALSTDLSVEGVHFRLGWISPAEAGWRAAAGALSDLAAVAATPVGILVSLGVSEEWPEEHVSELVAGAGEAAASVGATVLGGDLVRSERTIVDVAVLGRLQGEGAAIGRGGARLGEGLWVTGALGGPHAALRAWQAGREPERTARERFVRPTPRIAEAQWLRDKGARTMIDLSDGLARDAGHLAAASGVALVLDAGRVPVHSGSDDPLDALVGGEEYELLVALDTSKGGELIDDFAAQFGIPLTEIGRVIEGDGVSVEGEGKPVEVEGMFGHFA